MFISCDPPPFLYSISRGVFCNIKQDTHTDGFALVFVTVSYKKKERRINSDCEERWSCLGGVGEAEAGAWPEGAGLQGQG